ncbi:MAG: gamma-glutamyl-gamma-aminobutyrate hydrolase family protein [Myxococcota bacterium]|nr:gamma-glutamyl-gamma-aminobutyrate hydrolase family protein [Myxococcota bacterium]
MLVLVTAANRMPPTPENPVRVRPPRLETWISESYVSAIRQAGGTPLIQSPSSDLEELDKLLEVVSAVVITGGHFDIHPKHYGQAVQGRLDTPDDTRTHSELELARRCMERNIPILGVCGGMQALVVAAGGDLIQDIATQHSNQIDHEQETDPTQPWHTVTLDPSSKLASMGETIQVNSTHHQAAGQLGALHGTGHAPDGICEVVELPKHRFCVGVQWHPELIDPSPYNLLLEAAR